MLMLVKMRSMYFIFWTNGLKGTTEQGKVGTEEKQPTCQGKKVRVITTKHGVLYRMTMAVVVVSAPRFVSLFTKSQGCFV